MSLESVAVSFALVRLSKFSIQIKKQAKLLSEWRTVTSEHGFECISLIHFRITDRKTIKHNID